MSLLTKRRPLLGVFEVSVKRIKIKFLRNSRFILKQSDYWFAVDFYRKRYSYHALQFITKFSTIRVGLNWSPDTIVFIRGAHSARLRINTRMNSTCSWNCFVYKQAYRKLSVKVKVFFLSVFFFKFYISLSRVSSKRVENNSVWLRLTLTKIAHGSI